MKYSFVLLLVIGYCSAFCQTKSNIEWKVEEERLVSGIESLSGFGKDSLGRGYRVAFSKGDKEARAWFVKQMKQAGLDVRIDAAGNLIGRRNGHNASLPAIAFGSHIDMVPDGGNYDGDLGSVAGLAIMQLLQEQHLVTNHPLELIVFSDEEGSLIGSSAMAGHVKKEGLNNITNSGLTIRDGIRFIGGNPDSLDAAARKKGELLAFLELHIEQGAILENAGLQIGVVQGIVGIEHWEVTVTGVANHAGTTPMNLRHDALLSAAKLIVAVNDVINSHEGKQVGTIGKIAVQPGAFNVVPGKAVLGLEIRDLSSAKIDSLFADIQLRAADIANAGGTEITFKNLVLGATPALTDSLLQHRIAASAKELGLSYQYMQSGAGHDSQDMAMIVPVGMIFVPSAGGLSHTPKEYTTPADMANGANVLLHTLLSLDKQ